MYFCNHKEVQPVITYKSDSKEALQSTESSMPVLAMCYDFDKTLTPDDMQAQGFIQSVGYNEEQIKQFWQESNELAKKNDMDNNLAYMYKMIQEAVGHFYVTKDKLMEYGNQVELYEGVRTWFERICQYGLEQGVKIEHYIISSGLKEMIEGTEMAKEGAFTKIYASAFMFDDKGVAVWPAQAINYTNKTQFLFRIQKGILDINDTGVNDYINYVKNVYKLLGSELFPIIEEIYQFRVSAHCLIERNGKVTQYVSFNDRAWHAGLSCFEGRDKCNDFAIGIELEGSNEQPFTAEQYQVLAALTRDIMQAYPKITLDRIVGHCDISPGRKIDPGQYFEWERYLALVKKGLDEK